MIRFKVLIAASLCLLSAAASAGVYRWVDADGRVHYTDKPVQNSEPVDTHSGQPKGAQPLPGPTPDSSLTPEQLAQRKADCDQKKQQMTNYKTAAKIVETDSLGRQHEFSEDERKLLLKKTEQGMQESCGAAGISTSSSDQR